MTRDDLLQEIDNTTDAISKADGFDRMMLESKLESLKKSVGFTDLDAETPASFFAKEMGKLQ